MVAVLSAVIRGWGMVAFPRHHTGSLEGDPGQALHCLTTVEKPGQVYPEFLPGTLWWQRPLHLPMRDGSGGRQCSLTSR